MPVYRGGRTIYGAAIGILILDTRFPRLPGDIGNASTFDFPVRIKVVEGATARRVITDGDPTVIDDFVAAAKVLEGDGVRAITTSCGYLTTVQGPLTQAVGVPVFSSSLMQVPMVARMLPAGRKVGILTLDSRRLSRTHLEMAGIREEPLAIMGAEAVPAFYDNHIGDVTGYDPADVERAVVAMVTELVGRNPDVGAIVCEGTNFAPHGPAVQEALGLPWFDIVELTRLVHASVVKQRRKGFM